MPPASITDTTTTAMAPAVTFRTGAIVAFPPAAHDVAAVAHDIEQLPASELLPTANILLGMAIARASDPGSQTQNLHAAFGAMLALCRLLDEAGYPWDRARGSARMSGRTSRRAMFGAMAGAALLPATAAMAAPATISPAIQAAWAAYDAARTSVAEINAEYEPLRAALVEQWGDPVERRGFASDLWGHDPRYPRFHDVFLRSCAAEFAEDDRRDELLALPATRAEELHLKAEAVLDVWKGSSEWHDELDCHETLALEFMREAHRVLGRTGA